MMSGIPSLTTNQQKHNKRGHYSCNKAETAKGLPHKNLNVLRTVQHQGFGFRLHSIRHACSILCYHPNPYYDGGRGGEEEEEFEANRIVDELIKYDET